jgi:hypothetical protein
VLAVNQAWSTAVLSLRPALLSAALPTPALDDALFLTSRLRRHIGQLGQTGDYKLSLMSTRLRALVHALPQLRSLTATVRLLSDSASPLLFLPPRLECLDLLLLDALPGARVVSMDPLLAAVGQLSRLHTLRLQLPLRALASFAPLQQLPLLRDLHLHSSFWSTAAEFSTSLRALPSLHRLHIDGPRETHVQAHRVALFNTLLRDAPEEERRALQWRDFTIAHLHFTDELTPLLCRLPLLERLQANLSHCSQFDFLTALPRLTHLEVNARGMESYAWTKLLAVFTSNGLTRLRTLELHSGPCTSDDLLHLLSHTPSLTTLVLDELPTVGSLSFFSRLPKLAETLTALKVECYEEWKLNGADLPPLFLLQQLRSLRLLHWPNESTNRLTAADRAPLEQRPCTVLPNLEVFEWSSMREALY